MIGNKLVGWYGGVFCVWGLGWLRFFIWNLWAKYFGVSLAREIYQDFKIYYNNLCIKNNIIFFKTNLLTFIFCTIFFQNTFANTASDIVENKPLKQTLTTVGLASKFYEIEKVSEKIQSRNISIRQQITKLTQDMEKIDRKINDVNGVKFKGSNKYKIFHSDISNRYKIDFSNIKKGGVKITDKLDYLTKNKAAIAKFNTDLKNAKPGIEKLSKFDKIFTKTADSLDSIGKAVLVLDVANDAFLLEDRVENGSSTYGELLLIGLKVVESFQPTIPFTATPSDVGRAMLDLLVDSKNENKSLLNFNLAMSKNIDQIVEGDSSIYSFLLKKLSAKSFNEEGFYEELDVYYNTLTNEYIGYMRDLLSVLDDQDLLLRRETEKAFIPASIELYSVLRNGILIQKNRINNEIDDIEKGKGYYAILEFSAWYINTKIMRDANLLDNNIKEKDSLKNLINSLRDDLALVPDIESKKYSPYYYPYVKYLFDKRFVDGDFSAKFIPNENITKLEFLKITAKISKDNNKYISELLKGNSELMSRREIASELVNWIIKSWPDAIKTVQFHPNPPTGWDSNSYFLKDFGIADSNVNGFNLDSKVTRAEAAKLLVKSYFTFTSKCKISTNFIPGDKIVTTDACKN